MLKTVSLVGFLVMLAIIVFCVLLAVLVPSVRHLRRQAQETQCGHNLKQIGLALHNYHDEYKKFPWAITYAKDGTPMHSWRVRVLPYAVSSAMYAAYDFDEPWNGPKNGLLGDDVPDTWLDGDGTVRRNPNGTLYKAVYFPPVYRCPSAPTSQNQMCTNYVMLIDDRPGKPNGPPNLPGSVPPKFDDKSAVISAWGNALFATLVPLLLLIVMLAIRRSLQETVAGGQ